MAVDKTRIMTAAEAARLLSRKPKVVGDTVVFACENGHRVVAPISDGGKRGTCSKCRAPLIVPVAEAEGEAAGATAILTTPRQAAATEPEGPSPDEVPDVAAQQAEDAEAPAPRENGGAVSEVEAAQGVGEGSGDETAAGMGTTDDAMAQAWQFMEPTAEGPDAVGTVATASTDGEWAGFAAGEESDAQGFDNPTARLVARLWVEHELGGTLELHLQDGSVVFPQSYEPRWSRGTHGLFAAAAPDGSITLTAVAWESVQKIVVRNVKGLPEGMFE